MVEVIRAGETEPEQLGETQAEFSARLKKELEAKREAEKEPELVRGRQEIITRPGGSTIIRTFEEEVLIREQRVSGKTPSAPPIRTRQPKQVVERLPTQITVTPSGEVVERVAVERLSPEQLRRINVEQIIIPEAPRKIRPQIEPREPTLTERLGLPQQIVQPFKAGFFFEEPPDVTIPATAQEQTVFAVGQALGIISFAIGEPIGIVLGKVPGVSKLAVGAEQILSKPSVQIGLGALAGGQIITTGIQEGSRAAGAEILNIARDIFLIGGVIKGAKPTEIALDFSVETFQDTSVIRGGGTVEGRSFTETTVSTDLGKTATSDITVGNQRFIIERGIETTTIKQIDPITLRTIRITTEPTQLGKLKTRIDSVRKLEPEVITDITTPTLRQVVTEQKNLVRLVAEQPFADPKTSLELDVKGTIRGQAIAPKPQRSIDKFITTGEKVPVLREIGEVEFVFDKDVQKIDFLRVEKVSEGVEVERVIGGEGFGQFEEFRVGRGRLKVGEQAEDFGFSGGVLQEPGLVREFPIRFPKPTISDLNIKPSVEVIRPEIRKPTTLFNVALEVPVQKKIVPVPSDVNVVGEGFVAEGLSSTPIDRGVRPEGFVDLGFEKVSEGVEVEKVIDDVAVIQDVSPVQEVSVRKKVRVRQDVSLEQDVSLAQDVSLKQDISLQVPTVSGVRIRSFEQKIPKPVLPSIDLPFGTRKTQSLFDVVVGRPGRKTRFAIEGLTLQEAFRRGKRGVETTPAATFRVFEAEGGEEVTLSEEEIEARLGTKFRLGVKGGFVERKQFRISTPGELAGITKLGIEASKQKKKGSFFGRIKL